MTFSALPAGFIASAARTFQASSGSSIASETINLGQKSSRDVLDFTLNFAEWLADISDTLTSVDLYVPNNAAVPYPIRAVAGGVYQMHSASLILACGEPGATATFSIIVTTAQGRVCSQPVSLLVNTATPRDAGPTIGGPIIPSDATLNGGLFIVGPTALSSGLFSNGGIIMTSDPDNLPSGTVNNGGVIMKEVA